MKVVLFFLVSLHAFAGGELAKAKPQVSPASTIKECKEYTEFENAIAGSQCWDERGVRYKTKKGVVYADWQSPQRWKAVSPTPTPPNDSCKQTAAANGCDYWRCDDGIYKFCASNK